VIFRRFFTGAVFLIMTMSCFSQADTLAGRKEVSSAIKISLNGSLIYPGSGLGIEFPVNSVDLMIRSKTKEEKLIIKDRFISLNAGWYHHQSYHDNLYFTLDWIMRRTKRSGFFTEFSPGLGYSRTFLGGTTYRVDNNGRVDIIKSAGYSYAVLTAGGGLGFNFSQSTGLPFSVYWNFRILTMFPYNSTIYFRPVMELGMIYKPGKFIPVNIKRKISEK
jgi:hypothetical protein